MPIYVYKCNKCGHVLHDFQFKYIGSRDIVCPKCCVRGENFKDFPDMALGHLMQRDYNAEHANIIPDWEPGYNPGIDEHYTGKADLMRKIKRKGLRPMQNDGSIASRTSGGLYGDEEFKDVMNYSEPFKDDDPNIEYVELGPNEIPPGG